MATAVKPPATPTTSKSTPTLWQQAIDQAKSSYAAAAAPIQGEQQASDAYYKQRGVDAQTNAASLSALLAKLAPGVSAPYQDAAQTQGALAKGFSQGMQDALNGDADKSNALLAQLNSPAQIDPHSAEAGDALYGLGGYIPGAEFSKTGAAFGAAAAMQPGIALRQGQENSAAASASGAAAHSSLDSKLATLAGQIPGDAEDNYQKLQKLALDNKKFAFSVSKEKFGEAAKIADQKLKLAKYQTDVQYKQATLKLRSQSLDLQARKFANQQFQEDRNFQVKLTQLGISQRKEQRAAVAQEYKLHHGGFTPSQLNRFRTDAHGTVLHVKEALTLEANGAKDSKGNAVVAPTYQQAMAVMMDKHVPLSVASKALAPLHLKGAPGDAGDPTVSWDFTSVSPFTRTANAGTPFLRGGPVGRVSVNPGADRAGVSTVPVIKSFAGSLAGALGTTVTIGTGTNHNEMTTDGNVSDHWTGHAADITMVGSHAFYGTGPDRVDPALTRAGQRALILAGANPAWAKQQTGGLFNLTTPAGRVQIIFNTFQGGNHYNHLHVGIE